MPRRDNLGAALDEWGVQWRPEYGMKAALSFWENCSYVHAYDDEVFPETLNEVNRIEIIGDPQRVRFLLNGRELFAGERPFLRPYRQIELKTRAGAVISNLAIECEGPHKKRQPHRRQAPPLVSACVDFGDDLLYAPYTSEMLDLMVQRLAEVNVQRIYWLHTMYLKPEAFGPDADPELSRNLAAAPKSIVGTNALQTMKDCYPFLPKICRAAHARGMSVYATLKPFDLPNFPSRGKPSPWVLDHFQDSHPEAAMARCPDPAGTSSADEPVRTIKLYQDDSSPHGIVPEQLTVWTSDDNERFVPVDPPARISLGTERKRFERLWSGGLTDEREVQVIVIDGLDIRSDYFAVTVADTGSFTFRNRIYRMTEILDANGRVIPISRSLPAHPTATSTTWDGNEGFVFRGFTVGNPTGCWRGNDWADMYHALDGDDVGIGFKRGRWQSIRGMPTPAHPESHRFWTQWVQDALNAGVDGVDLRITNHNNILDWANYGFGPETETAFRQRYGRDLRPTLECRRDHMTMLGDMYTDFVRLASRITRDAGKKLQHHVSQSMDANEDQRCMSNIRWHWRTWIAQGLLDSITLKNGAPSTNFFEAVVDAADTAGIETMWCPYLNNILTDSASWAQQMANAMQAVEDNGLHGIILYEVASFLQANDAGDVVLKYPGLGQVLRP